MSTPPRNQNEVAVIESPTFGDYVIDVAGALAQQLALAVDLELPEDDWIAEVEIAVTTATGNTLRGTAITEDFVTTEE